MPDQRKTDWQALAQDGAFDVVVVGGGVNGIGTYRELALQGLRVLLVERGDFASGCSAAPSRMIHGGLRYLENGEFDLVRESLQERDALLRNAPHMVRPLPTLIPIASVFSGLFNSAASFLGVGGKPKPRGAVPIRLGLALYDWLTRHRRLMPQHSFAGPAGTRAMWPELTPKARFSAIYHDAWIGYPERLCIEMLRDVARDAPGSVALNYVAITPEGAGFSLRDVLTGASLPVQPKLIVNATGAWLDETARSLGGVPQARMVEGTKGSHLILDNPALFAALRGHMAYFENEDGRVCIVFPFHDRVLAGSTDIRVTTPGRVACEVEERDYILGALQGIFPEIPVRADQIVFSYSGIRPLPQSDQDFTGRISRGHDLRELPGAVPQLCMIGGKWTTFRAFAEQVTDAVLMRLGRSRRVETLTRAIGGGAGFDAGALRAELSHLPPARAEHLLSRYGSAAGTVARACTAEDRPLSPATAYSRDEIAHLIRSEYVQHLSDLALRRTDLAISGLLSAEIIAGLAEVLAEVRALADAQVTQQISELEQELARFHGVSAETLTTRDTQRRAQCGSVRKHA